MLEKLGGLAEQVATQITRRRFVDWMGKGAAGLAAGLAGLFAAEAKAATNYTIHVCFYSCRPTPDPKTWFPFYDCAPNGICPIPDAAFGSQCASQNQVLHVDWTSTCDSHVGVLPCCNRGIAEVKLSGYNRRTGKYQDTRNCKVYKDYTGEPLP